MDLKSYEDLEKIVLREEALRRDVECRSKELRVIVRHDKERKRNEYFLLARPRNTDLAQGGEIEIPFTGFGIESFLGSRLRLPVPFMLKDAPVRIAQETVDHFLKQGRARGFRARVRKTETGWTVLGILPSTFPRFNNPDMLDALGALARTMGMAVLRYRLSDTEFAAHLVLPEDVDVGGRGGPDKHRFGIWFRHSDVGYHAPAVEFAVVRQICSNGMIGITGEPLVTISRSALNNLSTSRLSDRICGRVKDALKVQEKFLEVMAASRGAPSPEATARNEIARLLQRFKMPARYFEIVAGAFRAEAGSGLENRPDRWSVAQAFTRAAHGMEPELSEKFERLAWDYVAKAL